MVVDRNMVAGLGAAAPGADQIVAHTCKITCPQFDYDAIYFSLNRQTFMYDFVYVDIYNLHLIKIMAQDLVK